VSIQSLSALKTTTQFDEHHPEEKAASMSVRFPTGGRRAIVAALAVGFLSMAAGCGGSDVPTGTVQGRLNFPNGQATPARVQLYSAETGVGTATDVGDDGTFQFDAEVPVGTYRVTVTPPEPPPPGEGPSTPLPPSTIPEKYRSDATTPLTVTVTEGENNFPLDVAP
jgi:hypothetical protein